MKYFVKKFVNTIKQPLDLILSFLIIPAAYLLYFFRRIGPSLLPKTSQRLKKIGVYPIRDHYYEPLFNDKNLIQPLDKDRTLPGLDLNLDNQLNFLSKLVYANELDALNLTAPAKSDLDFCLENGSFGFGDAEFLYQIIRKNKPNKIIEIGSGSSTKIARLAVEKNKRESGRETIHICVEPYEQPWLKEIPGITLIRERIEKLDFDWSSELSEGDLLFVDSSHMIRPQGDVLTEYLQIFPSLKYGVYVHIHDIFTPKDYLKRWIIDDVRFWNEQYLLEALLTNTDRYEIVAALNYLKHHHYDQLREVCPYLTTNSEPGSFYFKIS
jgi:hypothetical protein